MSESKQDHIYPVDAKMLPPEAKETLLGQQGMVFWLTGLSGSGKSTVAIQVERHLHAAGHLVKMLDGDNIRNRINSDLGFSMEARKENIRRVAEIARLFRETGVITLCTFICPTIEARAMARDIIGAEHFREIFIDCDLDEAERRDPKGLYKKARAGVIKDFTGIHSPYEKPENPDLIVPTHLQSIGASAQQLLAYIQKETQVGDRSFNVDVPSIVAIAETAGLLIMEVYESDEDAEISTKADDSPITLADRRANEHIVAQLRALYPQIPIISEEEKLLPYEERKNWSLCWQVDPLDGTKEFIRRNGEFAVNIALIQDGVPVVAVVHAPARDITAWATKGEGAFLRDDEGNVRKLESKSWVSSEPITIVASRSHPSPDVQAFMDRFPKRHVQPAGSSLKFILLAMGEAHVYPRLAPTMEWDTSAGQLILEEAGGEFIDEATGKPMLYNRENLTNGNFMAYGRDVRTGIAGFLGG
ncbi:MAG: 3'(2'),5'-bisphosphate nucleotidase CysQ [Bacteroidota bacterium]